MNGDPTPPSLTRLLTSFCRLGFLAGLIGITPAAGFVSPSGAFVIGIVTGASCFAGVKIKNSFDIDDSLDAFGIHAIGGIVGGLLTGLLANSAIGGEDGAFHGSGRQLGIQIYGIVVSAGWSVVGTALVMLFVDQLIGLRVSKQSELVGLDRAEHDTTMTSQGSSAAAHKVPDNASGSRFKLFSLSFLHRTVA
jgi:ammonium transporter, Amt family